MLLNPRFLPLLTIAFIQTSGFTDVAPVVREQTVKAVLAVIDKLSDRTINGDLLKFLARTANDEQPGIRTNTTICLGKIAKNLGQSVGRTTPPKQTNTNRQYSPDPKF